MFMALLTLGLFATVISFRLGALFKMLGATVFFSLAIIMFAGYEVGYTSEIFDNQDCSGGLDSCTAVAYLVREDPDTGETHGEWMGWIFMVFGIFNSMLFIVEMIPR